MRTVNISIGHQNDLVIAQFLDVELVVNSSTQRGDDRLNLVVLQHAIQPRLLHVQNLSSKRKNGLVHRITARFSRTTSGITLHDVELGEHRVLGSAIG